MTVHLSLPMSAATTMATSTRRGGGYGTYFSLAPLLACRCRPTSQARRESVQDRLWRMQQLSAHRACCEISKADDCLDGNEHDSRYQEDRRDTPKIQSAVCTHALHQHLPNAI